MKPFENFLCLDDMVCYENSSRKGLEVAAVGVSKGREWVKQCLDYYSGKVFDLGNGLLETKVMPEVVRDVLSANNWILHEVNGISEAIAVDSSKGIAVFPYEFFSPKSYETGKLTITGNTHSIHHFAASWHGPKEKIYQLVGKLIGKKNAKKLAECMKELIVKH